MINKGRTITAMLNDVLWNRQITRKNKLQIYVTEQLKLLSQMKLKYGNLTKNIESKLISMEMD